MSSKIHVNKPLSSRLIIELLDENPDLETIECPQSLYERTSQTYLDALNELGITISIIEQRGRPQKYDEGIRDTIDEMLNSGFNPKAIAKVVAPIVQITVHPNILQNIAPTIP